MQNDPANCVDLWGLTASDSSSINYPIRSGETLSQITRDHNYRYATNYTAEEIAALNGISNPDLIYAGNTLTLPVPLRKATVSLGSENSLDQKGILKRQLVTSGIQMLGGITESVAGYYTGNIYSQIHGAYNTADGLIGVVQSLSGNTWNGMTSEITSAILSNFEIPSEVKEMAVLAIDCVDLFISDICSSNLSDAGKTGQLVGNFAKIWNSMNDIACSYAEVESMDSKVEVVITFIDYLETLRK